MVAHTEYIQCVRCHAKSCVYIIPFDLYNKLMKSVHCYSFSYNRILRLRDLGIIPETKELANIRIMFESRQPVYCEAPVPARQKSPTVVTQYHSTIRLPTHILLAQLLLYNILNRIDEEKFEGF